MADELDDIIANLPDDEPEDLPDEPEDAPEEPEESEPELHPQYMTQEQWNASGRDPKKWLDPVRFEIRGEFIEREKRIRSDYDNRFKNMALLHRGQLEVQREQLMALRDEAIETGDKKQVHYLDKKIQAVATKEALLDDQEEEVKQQANQPQKLPEIAAWEQANKWVFDKTDPRTDLANALYSQKAAAGWTPKAILAYIDAEVAKVPIPRKHKTNLTESTRSHGGGKDTSVTVTMKTLTEDEKAVWKMGIFKDEKTFLQSVADDRRSRKNA